MRRLDLSHERVADTSQNGWMLREGAGRVWEKRVRRKQQAILAAKEFCRQIATKEEPVILTVRRRFGHVQEERTYPRGYDPGRPLVTIQPAPAIEPAPEFPPVSTEPETEPATETESKTEDSLEPVSA